MKTWIRDFIIDLQEEADAALSHGVKGEDVQNLLAQSLGLYRVLQHGSHLPQRQRDKTFIRHTNSCIGLADKHRQLPDEAMLFLENANRSLQNVLWESKERPPLALVIEFKRSILSKSPSERVAAKLRECHQQLLKLAPIQMQIVLPHFSVWNAVQLRQVLDAELWQSAFMAVLSGNAPTKSHAIDMDWIPQEHIKMMARERQPFRQKRCKAGRPEVSSNKAGTRRTRQNANGRMKNDTELSSPPSSHDQKQRGQSASTGQSGDSGQSLSKASKKWLEENRFRLACKTCFTLKRNQDDINTYSLNLNPAHGPKCRKDLLLCQLEKNGPSADSSTVYGLVRPRPNRAKEIICAYFTKGKCQLSLQVSCLVQPKPKEVSDRITQRKEGSKSQTQQRWRQSGRC
ncbi:uncharacterized protein [Diadema antillarum]|uniref:uncharacterized protein n=1 Tax=Diadema antillarum TaxID=105358 RepID=UPI003A86CDAF